MTTPPESERAETAWTPGPWIADQRVIRDTGNHHVATAWRQDGGGIAGQPEPIADANARLISTAPEWAEAGAKLVALEPREIDGVKYFGVEDVRAIQREMSTLLARIRGEAP